MTRLHEFQLESPWGLALLVVIPLLVFSLFLIHRRRARTAEGPWVFSEPENVGRRLAIALALCVFTTLAGLLATGWVLLAGQDDPFHSPLFLVGLGMLGLCVLIAAVAVASKRRHRPVLLYSGNQALASVRAGRPSGLRFLVPVLRLLAIVLILFALARPQVATTEADVFTEGMDIVLTLDVSTSMRAVDFAPDSRPRDKQSRINGAKEVIANFIRQRTDDRLGLVVFASEAFTQCPLTLDYSVLQNVLRSVKTGVIEDGTAIGNAIMISVNRLRDSEVKSKVVILLTDGDDNASKVAPLQAAEIAAEEGIKVFPILVGKGGMVDYPVGPNLFGQMQYRKVEIRTNPELLKNIAEVADGKFYRAKDEEALKEDLQDILDHMEKTRLMDPGRFTRSTEVFQLYLLPALLILLGQLSLSWTRFRSFP